MDLTHAAIYYSMWIAVSYLSILLLRWSALLIIPTWWEHLALAVMTGLLAGAGWYSFVREMKWYLY